MADKPVVIWGQADLARARRVSRQRIKQLVNEGRLPPPDYVSRSGAPYWRRITLARANWLP